MSSVTEAALWLSSSPELSLVAKATAIMAMGLGAAYLARAARASVRHLFVASSLLALIVLPILAAAVPPVSIQIPVPIKTPVEARNVEKRDLVPFFNIETRNVEKRDQVPSHLAIVQLLVAKGADINARIWNERYQGGGEWRTAISQARKNGHADVVRFLESRGARE